MSNREQSISILADKIISTINRLVLIKDLDTVETRACAFATSMYNQGVGSHAQVMGKYEPLLDEITLYAAGTAHKISSEGIV